MGRPIVADGVNETADYRAVGYPPQQSFYEFYRRRPEGDQVILNIPAANTMC